MFVPDYIVVQAGGMGTRMKYLTRNKPKALVPVDNLPVLFHLFRKYPDSRYIIIGDYKYDVLERYLKAFADVKYTTVCATGCKGTCSGLKKAIDRIPEDEPFLLIWSDLILPEECVFPEEPGNYIGVAKDFSCRWKYENNIFAEERSDTFGVAGLFIFRNKTVLSDVPEEGELVSWLSETGLVFKSLPLYRVKEYGLLSEYEKQDSPRCRPFNRIYVKDEIFVKEPVNAQGYNLAKRETAWYRKIQNQYFINVPKIISYEPLKMELIDGKAIYEYDDLTYDEKAKILRKIVDCLKSVHELEQIPSDQNSFYEAYIRKTFQRLEKIRSLVPFSEKEYIMVNGRKCHNIFFCQKDLEKKIVRFFPAEFKLIHGDCTFSNIMLRADGTPVLIDPRGYFGTTELYGDPAYDWSKLYYSVVGNYDQFNRRRFSLEIGEDSVMLNIASNGWESLEPEFFRLLEGEITPEQIKLNHAIIWLSLTTYVWEDYDSICGAFYNGIYYLEELM